MLVRWNHTADPFIRDFSSIQRQMDAVLQDVFGRRSTSARPTSRRSGLSVRDAGTHYTVTGLLAGVKTDDLDLKATSTSLTLGTKRNAAAPEGFTAIQRERAEFTIERTFEFDTRIDLSTIDAALKDGVLTVNLQKAADAQPRTVPINAK